MLHIQIQIWVWQSARHSWLQGGEKVSGFETYHAPHKLCVATEEKMAIK
jgi:hypothetical protein